jgi:alkanesulfonate monooxygenase SsuD/methylene tetrahydromethanopterin reductase-like flavin-dependent oxidoreductase (luciferase family)
MPASVYSSNSALIEHFDIFAQASAAAERHGDRTVHRVVRDVFIADTDAEARKLALEGGMGRAWREYLLPTYHAFGIAEAMIEGTGLSVSDVTLEYLADNFWIVGSPETVQEKFETWTDKLGGGFGTLLMYSYDYIDNPTPWEESMRRMARKSRPSCPTTRRKQPMSEAALLVAPPAGIPVERIVDFDVSQSVQGPG